MTAQRDQDRLIRAFLDEGLTELPDRSFDAVRAAVDRTRQRTVLGPWRTPTMQAVVRPMTMVAAVAATAVLGLLLLNRSTLPPAGSPPPGTTPPTPSPVIESAAPATPAAYLPYRWPRPLDAGRYGTSMAWDFPFAAAFTLPAGWESRDVEVIHGAMSVALQDALDLYRDPCSATSATIDTGATPADFALALASVQGLAVSVPKATTFGGLSSTSVTYHATGECVGESTKLWSNPEWRLLPVEPLGPPSWPLRTGVHRLFILDAPYIGRLLIDATAGPNPTAADEVALQGILDSIEIVPPAESRALGACSVTLTMPANPSLAVGPGATVPMGDGVYPILGPTSENQFGRPYAQVDFRVSGITGSGPASNRPWAKAVPPLGATAGGAATLTSASDGSPAIVGSFLLDGPGRWWIGVSVPYADCAWQQPIDVTAG